MISETQDINPGSRIDGVRYDASYAQLPEQEPGQEKAQETAVQDSVYISRDGQKKSAAVQDNSHETPATTDTELSTEDQQEVEKLKRRDQEVRAHEQAHLAAGGGIVQGGAVYQFEQGPDGNMYAVGGEVKIDSSPEEDPADTIRKMIQVRRAALAPMDPSATDRAVAAQAYQLENQARVELARQDQEASSSNSGDSHTQPSPDVNAPRNPYLPPEQNGAAPGGLSIMI